MKKQPQRAQPAGEPTVEQALARLEEIVRRLEQGEVELTEALALSREGRELHDLCVRRIAACEAQLEILTAGGELAPEGPAPPVDDRRPQGGADDEGA